MNVHKANEGGGAPPATRLTVILPWRIIPREPAAELRRSANEGGTMAEVLEDLRAFIA
jgi:hypothetical protein